MRALFLIGIVTLASVEAKAFCGFFVAKADTKLFNKASQVVLVRDEDKTVLTMSNDFQGKVKDFAMVIPVPTAITREQIHIGDRKVLEHLDAYTAPRLVEYHDSDPCAQREYLKRKSVAREGERESAKKADKDERARALGVKIEAQYTVGEYDILILSAKQSDGLVIWLKEEGYKIPNGAEAVVESYLKQSMKFFVAKVNLAEHDKLGGGMLRPIQVAYESPKLMLPIRLGTINADGTQDIIVFTLTRQGRVETTNYRTVKLPSNVNVPEYTKDVFGDFYKDMFARTVQKNDMKAVITEYAWDMAWCDPCAAEPLTSKELRSLGVFWVDDQNRGGAQNVYVTRLHARYDRKTFPEDLVFQVTQDRSNFQGRYIMQHPFKGEMTCAQADAYREQVWQRQQKEAETLADLTGWKIEDIRARMKLGDKPKGKKWFENIWKE